MRAVVALAVMTLLVGGCAQRSFTHTSRSAVEQLLLSSAVDRALAKFELPEVEGRKVFCDLSNLKSYDVEYVRVATRVRFGQLGAVLVDTADEADYVAEIASGGLGIEHKTSVVGLPPLPVPNSPLGTPEVPMYRATEQTGIFKLLIFVHQKGRFVTADQYYAKSDRDESFVFWYKFQRQDNVREGWERADVKLDMQANARAAAKQETASTQ